MIEKFKSGRRALSWIWTIRVVPAKPGISELPKFKVAKELVVKSTGRPPERVVELQELFRQLIQTR
jgi:hypothetical protein